MSSSSNGPAQTVGSRTPFTFGPELEMILRFRPDGYKQAVKACKELAGILDLENRIDPDKDFAKFIAKLITKTTKKEIKCVCTLSSEAAAMKKNNTFYDVWLADVDPSLKGNTDNGEYAVELVSPVKSSNTMRWQNDIVIIFVLLEQYFEVLGVSGSTHVHLRQVTLNNEEKATNMAFAKAVSKFIVFWDPCFWRLVPPSRQTTEYAEPNMGRGPLRVALEQDPKSKNSGKTYGDIFQIIENLCDPSTKLALEDGPMFKDSVKQMESYRNKNKMGFQADLARLAAFINGNDRQAAWNLFNLCLAGKGMKRPSGTIEYRRPPPAKTFHEVFETVAMSLCFVYGAVKFAKADNPWFVEMCHTEIVALDYDTQILKDEGIEDFASCHMHTFGIWMKEAASDLGLVDYLRLPPAGSISSASSSSSDSNTNRNAQQ